MFIFIELFFINEVFSLLTAAKIEYCVSNQFTYNSQNKIKVMLSVMPVTFGSIRLFFIPQSLPSLCVSSKFVLWTVKHNFISCLQYACQQKKQYISSKVGSFYSLFWEYVRKSFQIRACCGEVLIQYLDYNTKFFP